MGFKAGVVRGVVLINDTLAGNTNIAGTSNTGTISLGNASVTAINVIGPTNINIAGALSTAIGSTSNTGTVAIGNTNSTSVTLIGPVNINTSSSNNTAINSTSNTGSISIGNTSSGTVAIDCGTAGIVVGTTANAHSSTFGSTSSTSNTTIQSGSGALNITATGGPLTINSGTGTLSISTDASATTINIGTGAAIKAVTLGSTTASATTTIKGPSAGVFAIGVASVAVANKNYVTMNTSTGALGSDAGPASSITITGDSGGGLTGNSFTFTGGSTGLTFAGAGSTETLGGTLAIANGGTNAATKANAQTNLGLGGTNATSMATSTGIVKYDGTRLVTSSTAKIDSSNIYTNTSQPAFFAFKTSNATNQTGAGATATVAFDSTVFDQNSNFSSSTTFTAPVTGLYHFDICVEMGSLTVLMTLINVNLVTTAKTYIFGSNSPGVCKTANNTCQYTGSMLISMTATDTAQVQVIIVNGAGNTASVDGNATFPLTFFSGYLVC